MAGQPSAGFQWSTLIGGMLLSAPNGVMWYWGNMAVYVLSYLRMTGTTDSPVQSPWLLSLYLMSWCVVLLMARSVTQRLGRKMTVVLGVLLTDGGLLVSHYAMQYSMSLLNVTHGILGGMGHGLIHSVVLMLVIESTEKYVGVAIAAISTSVNIGGAVMNQVVSYCVNPENKTPDLHLGPYTYFTQTDVIDHVPTSYLVLGGLAASLHLTGMALLGVKCKSRTGNEPQSRDKIEAAEKKDSTNGDVPNENRDLKNGYVPNQNRDLKNGVVPNENRDLKNGVVPNEKSKLWGNTELTDYKPTDVLRTRTFYILWIMLIVLDTGYLANNNYYKAFGEEFIQNDHSLANLGSVIPIVVAVSRVTWGLLIDMAYVKDIMVVFASGLSVGFPFYFLTPMVSAWLYYAWSILLSILDSGVFAVFAVLTLRLFGPAHFTTNYGLVMSSTILLNLLVPALFRLLLHAWGWFLFFASIGVLNCLGLVLVVVALPLV